MTGCPVPPRASNRPQVPYERTDARIESVPDPTPGIPAGSIPATSERPKPSYVPPIENKYGRLSENEVHYLLSATLTPEHHEDPVVLKFISSYLKCRNVSQSSREAGLSYSAGNYLRNRPDIHEAILKLGTRSLNKFGFDASEVVEKVKEIADVDPVVLEKPDGTYVESLGLLPAEVRRAIKKFKVKNCYETDPNGMKVVTGRIIEVEFFDKQWAIDRLAREKDVFIEKKKNEHTFDIGQNMKDALLESGKRAEERASRILDVTPLVTGRTDGEDS